MDWEKIFKFRYNEIVGLDIGSSSVRAVQMVSDSAGFTVTAVDRFEVDTEGEERSAGPEALAGVIDKRLSEDVFNSQWAVCSVCGPEVAVRDFKFPDLSKDEISSAVSLEASQVCPFNVETGSVQHQLIHEGAGGVYGMLVAATDRVIREKRDILDRTNMDCVLMDVSGLALLNCFAALTSISEARWLRF